MAGDVFDFIVKLTRCGKAVRGFFDYNLRDQNITLTQWELLMHLKESDIQELRQMDLANLMNVDKGAVVKLVDRLERDGWVKRKTNSDDLRSNLVALTPKLNKDSGKVEKILEASAKFLAGRINRSDIKKMSNDIEVILKAAKSGNQS